MARTIGDSDKPCDLASKYYYRYSTGCLSSVQFEERTPCALGIYSPSTSFSLLVLARNLPLLAKIRGIANPKPQESSGRQI